MTLNFGPPYPLHQRRVIVSDNKCDIINCATSAPNKWAYCDEHYAILYGEGCAPMLTLNHLQAQNDALVKAANKVELATKKARNLWGGTLTLEATHALDMLAKIVKENTNV
jgi:hypothetical protein